MAGTSVDRDAIESLVDILDERGLSELEYEHDGLRIRVARGTRPAGGAGPALAEAVEAAGAASLTAPAKAEGEFVESPMVGTFYVASSPESPPYVEIGDRVSKGQVVCIIEAMKLMNEIESEHDGVVAERLVDNAQGVEFGQHLFRIAKD